MPQTPLCTLLGIEFPIIQAGMGAFTSAELAAAVSNAGGLGSVGTFLRPVEDLPQQLARLRAGTSRPFAVNHLVPARAGRGRLRPHLGRQAPDHFVCAG